ncbi:MAG TPA: hypothetical protein VF932_06320, partial [Anaerolineae bacterium]
GEIPLDEYARVGGDLGKPVILGKPEAPAARAFAAIASALQVSIEQLPPPKLPQRVFKTDPALPILR